MFHGGRPRWLSIGQTAQRLGVSSSTVRRFIRRGDLGAVIHSPRIIRIAVETCDQFISEHQVRSTPVMVAGEPSDGHPVTAGTAGKTGSGHFEIR